MEPEIASDILNGIRQWYIFRLITKANVKHWEYWQVGAGWVVEKPTWFKDKAACEEVYRNLYHDFYLTFLRDQVAVMGVDIRHLQNDRERLQNEIKDLKSRMSVSERLTKVFQNWLHKLTLEYK